MKPMKGGEGAKGVEVYSGWNWHPKKYVCCAGVEVAVGALSVVCLVLATSDCVFFLGFWGVEI